jgi:Cys-tRNA(Pro) deacylase
MDATPATSDPRLRDVDHLVVRHRRVARLEEAAELRGVEPGAIVKTMIVRRSDDDYVFVLVPGDRVIDWPKLRDQLGERRLSMPDAEEARAVSGYERGTITPFGSERALPVVADERIGSGDVSIGGGDHGVSITLDGSQLLTLLEATIADVTKSG